ncbi:MAG TPA: SNF2-related protein [Chroococcidiopsis sp.]
MSKNYRITTSDEIGRGGAKTKAKANLAAIRLLKQLEAEQRHAEPDEQAVLVKFAGWGAVADIFTDKPEWTMLHHELQSLLSAAEYESARAATLNAYYTAPEIAAAIYDGLARLGFGGGKILDPSMGATGMFEGTLPEAWGDRTELLGVELDSLSGRIAQQLYPEASIHIRGFEHTILPDDQFDLAITNVPFSEIGVADPEYRGFPIHTLHDYFFVKALDKVRPGGLLAFITSSGTMQSAGSGFVREWLAERANLVGAMRLPSQAFKQVAGTEVTTDLIILQKRGADVNPNGITWSRLQPSSILSQDGEALAINEYYARHPHQMLGILADDKLHPGRLALNSDGRDLATAIHTAFNTFPADIYHPVIEEAPLQSPGILIPPALQDQVKPYGYVLHENQLMQRVGYYLEPIAFEGKKLERIKGMLTIRDAVQTVFQVQLQNGADSALQIAQATLNQTYDSFVKTYGCLSQTANKLVFRDDPDYPLLLALERYDRETKTATKTAIFADRVIQSHQEKTTANSPKEALLYSLNERGRVDLDYVARLVGKPEAEVTSELHHERLIFLDPVKGQWVTEDEYLSGDVKAKLQFAQQAAAEDTRYAINVDALQAVQPAPIPPGDIEVRLGAAWLPAADVQDFVSQLLEASGQVNVQYSPFLDVWSADADYRVLGSVKNTKIYGTDRVGAVRLIELGLNLKDPVVYDKVEERLVVNPDATAAARMKLEDIKVAFKDWVWQDPERTERLTNLYNDKFNTFRPRQYNGAHLELPGSNPAIQLRLHQKNAAWRVLQEGNALLAHCVGSGKTFTTIAAVMEQKRLGLVNKPMIVVPNHLLEQWAADFKRLYPNSNVLAATKDDASAQNRQELMSRIATGNWDAVIVTHSGFGKLKMSKDAQLDFCRAELEQVMAAAEEAKSNSSSRSMIKELERQKKRLEKRVGEVANARKDDVVTFEQLGVDQLYIDEAHYFKNLGYHTKMYGIAGLPNTTSDRALDLFMKCRYLGQQHGEGKGVVFATGTPVSNSMAELYTMQRYLQPQALRQIGLERFDAWASTFGETVTAPEITPAGGYKIKTRFSRFVNIPELMNTVRQVADIQTAEMLNLPTPQLKGGKPQVVAVAASDIQLAFVEELAKRAENIRSVDPRDDNMLLITTDGRKASLDMRLINPYIPHEYNKVDQLVEDAYEFWERTQGDRTTHLIFCDMGTPKEDVDFENTNPVDIQPHFTVYRYIKEGLIERGIPAAEIAFAQDFKTDAQKLEMQQKFNAGIIRVMISGAQLETGFNGQRKLGLESHLTVPWRPDQVEQRDGRILRQGNENSEVEIRRYVTQGRDGRPSFDSYMWQTLETKKKFISQVMAGNSEIRTIEDVSEAALTYAEVKAIATGNPLIMEKAEVDNRVSQLAAQKRSYLNQHYSINQELKRLPERIDDLSRSISALQADARKVPTLNTLTLVVQEIEFTDVKEAIKAVKAIVLEKQMKQDFRPELIGLVGGFDLWLKRERWGDGISLVLCGQQDYVCKIEHTYVATASNLISTLSNIEPQIQQTEWRLADAQKKLVELSQHSNDIFPKEGELQAALKRQAEINAELGLNKDNAQASEETSEDIEEGDAPEKGALGSVGRDESVEAIAPPSPAWNDLTVEQTAPVEHDEQAIAVESPNVEVSRQVEWEWAKEILRIAAIAYAYAGSQGQIQCDGECWTAAGKYYDISYNPLNENFFITGKAGNPVIVQSIAGVLDRNCTCDLSPVDLARFQHTEAQLNLKQSTLAFTQTPAQTQKIAQRHWVNGQPQSEIGQESTSISINALNIWHQYAIALGRSQRHLRQIEHVQSAVQQGKPLTERDRQVICYDKNAWQQQAQTILSNAMTILERIGISERDAKRFDGKTYQISIDAVGTVAIAATGRGEVLRAKDGTIIHASVTKADAERFQQFVSRLQSSATPLGMAERHRQAVECDRG